MNHLNVLSEVSRAYKQRVMNNVHRSEYVEAMVFLALRDSGWTRQMPWEWWDLEHESGVRLEVKQSAAAQGWGTESKSPPRFDIAARQSIRHARIYVFAWHGGRLAAADQRDPNTWDFYVVAESDLPAQQTIGLAALRSLSTPCRIEHLADRVLHLLGPA